MFTLDSHVDYRKNRKWHEWSSSSRLYWSDPDLYFTPSVFLFVRPIVHQSVAVCIYRSKRCSCLADSYQSGHTYTLWPGEREDTRHNMLLLLILGVILFFIIKFGFCLHFKTWLISNLSSAYVQCTIHMSLACCFF